MCVVLCVGERFACSVAFYFIDVGVLIWPGDAQKYVSRRSFVLFSFVTLYLLRVRVASFLYCVIFSCTNRRKTCYRINIFSVQFCLWFSSTVLFKFGQQQLLMVGLMVNYVVFFLTNQKRENVLSE